MPIFRGLSIRRLSPAYAVIILLLVAAGPTSGQRAPDVRDRVEALLAKYHELGLFNGSALVADHGEVLLRKGYGLANMEWGIANTPDTKFRLGSITKQFTSALVMQLVDRGEIDLAAPMTRYLPDYPAHTGDRITIHHLLNHTSGIVGYTELPTFGASLAHRLRAGEICRRVLRQARSALRARHEVQLQQLRLLLARRHPREGLRQEPYEQLLQERIFTPLGMHDSGYDSTRPLLSKRAAGYDKQFDGSYVNTALSGHEPALRRRLALFDG